MAVRAMASMSLANQAASHPGLTVGKTFGVGANDRNPKIYLCSPFSTTHARGGRPCLSLSTPSHHCAWRRSPAAGTFGKKESGRNVSIARPQAVKGLGNESLWEGDEQPEESLFARMLDKLEVPEGVQKGLALVIAFGSAVCVLALHYRLITLAGGSLLDTWRGTWASLMTGGTLATSVVEVGTLVCLVGAFFLPYLVPHPLPGIILAFPGLLAFMDYKRRWVDWALCAILSANFVFELIRALWVAKQARDVGILSQDVSFDPEEDPVWMRRLLTVVLPFLSWRAWANPSLSEAHLEGLQDEFDLRGIVTSLLFPNRNMLVYSAPVVVYLARMYFRATTRGIGIVIAPYFFLNAWWLAIVLGLLQIQLERWRVELQQKAGPVQFKLGVRAPGY